MATLDIPASKHDEQDALIRGKLSMMLADASARAIRVGRVKDVSYSEPEYNDEKTHATMIATIRYKQADAATKRENISLAKTADGWKVSL